MVRTLADPGTEAGATPLSPLFLSPSFRLPPSVFTPPFQPLLVLLSPTFPFFFTSPPPSLFLLPCLLAQLVGLRELTKLSRRRGRQRILDHFDSWKVKTLLLTANLVFLMLVLTIYLLKANKDSKKFLYCPNNYYKLSNAHQPMQNPATTKWLMTV